MSAFNLRAKLTLVIGALIAITIALVGIATRSVLHSALAKANEQRALDIGNGLARRLTPYVITNDPYELSLAVQSAAKDPHLKYIILMDPYGKVLMHNDLKEVGKTYEDIQSLRATASGAASSGSYFRTKEGDLVDDVVVPIILAEVKVGTLRFGFSHVDVENATALVSRKIVLIGSASTALALLGLFLASGFLVKPIVKLTEATRKVAQGDLSAFVSNNSKDELGVLADAFNKMTEELRTTTVSRDHLDNIFNSAGDSLLVIDTDFNVVAANKMMAGFLGSNSGNINGAKCFVLLNGSFCRTANCILRRIQQGEASVDEEMSVDLPDGRLRSVRVIGTPLMEKGQLVGIVESIQDITDHKEAEKEKELLRSQLLQAHKMESVGRLAGGVAHDFNNMLSVILGYTELMLINHSDEGPLVKNLQAMKTAADRAAALTRQLLAFSRKQLLSLQIVNINTVIENISCLLRSLIGENVVLEFVPGTPLDRVLVDSNQIEQVIMNLVINARDAMPDGGRIIIETENAELDGEYARTHAEVKTGQFVLVSVSDTGHGMSSEVQEKIFDPFFTTKVIGKGTGLGLATAYGIVKQHAGHIRVYSEPDHGTTFKVYLPATDNMETKSVAQRSTVLRVGTETILVVDDEASIRQLIKDILQPLGYRLLEASNGDEALRLCANAGEVIDILLTDVIMPGMNGLELSKAIKARRPEIKTIFMSGYTQNVIANGGVLKPGLIFIHKPLTSGKLAVALWNVLETGSISNGVTD